MTNWSIENLLDSNRYKEKLKISYLCISPLFFQMKPECWTRLKDESEIDIHEYGIKIQLQDSAGVQVNY